MSSEALSATEEKQIQDNRRIIVYLAAIIIFLYPVAFITEDNILRIILSIYICHYIKKHTTDYGKKYGKMSLRLGRGNFCNLKYLYAAFVIGTGMTAVEDLSSEILIYTAKYNYEPSEDHHLKFIKSFYKTAAFIPDIANRSIVEIIDIVEAEEGSVVELIKKKTTDHILYESMKRELCFHLIALRDRGVLIDKEERGVFEYFFVGAMERLKNSMIDFSSFLSRNIAWMLIYYAIAYLIFMKYLQKNTIHHSKN